MTCSKCKGDTKVKDSRDMKRTIRRRRECLRCEYRFTTEERVVEFTPKIATFESVNDRKVNNE